jgi:hypothetical protein
MLNRAIDLGDAAGQGHSVAMTPFDNGTVVLTAFNPDTGTTEQVVLMPSQWRELMSRLAAAYPDAPVLEHAH